MCDLSNDNTVNCGDYLECTGNTNGTIPMDTGFGTLNALCCSGSSSCSQRFNISANITRCDGYYSCNYTMGYIKGNNNIYFAGSYASGTDSNINTIITGNNIFCLGYQSCIYKIIRNAYNLYCTASGACLNSVMIKNIINIYAYGRTSIQSSVISNIYNLYCFATNACYEINIDNVYNNIMGMGRLIMYNSIIMNVNNTLLAFGYQSLYSSIITNVKTVMLYLIFTYQVCLIS